MGLGTRASGGRFAVWLARRSSALPQPLVEFDHVRRDLGVEEAPQTESVVSLISPQRRASRRESCFGGEDADKSEEPAEFHLGPGEVRLVLGYEPGPVHSRSEYAVVVFRPERERVPIGEMVPALEREGDLQGVP